MSSEAETSDPTAKGKKAVRRHLIEPLEAEGMIRPLGVTKDEMAERIERIVDLLAYMEAADLERARVYIAAQAGGTAKNRWPSILTIRNIARAIAMPPDPGNELVRSWFRSRAGVVAREAGDSVAMRWFLRTNKRPPAPVSEKTGRSYDLDAIAAKQAMLDRRVEQIRRDRANDELLEGDAEWLAEYEAVERDLAALIDEGIAHRAALGEGAQ